MSLFFLKTNAAPELFGVEQVSFMNTCVFFEVSAAVLHRHFFTFHVTPIGKIVPLF
jgi:hypothetical protein